MYLQIAVPSQAHFQKRNDVVINPLVGYFIISFPLLFLLTIISYRKCKASICKRRVEKLEKLWLLTNTEKTS
jgi:hypothetical protein